MSAYSLLRRIGRRPKRSKYGNVKVTSRGVKFDSKKESREYIRLLELKQCGEIKDFQHQVKFELIPKTDYTKPCHYIADFVIEHPDGSKEVVDVKSPASRTKEYMLKKKLMYWRHGIKIAER
jgi:hypothetical protein